MSTSTKKPKPTARAPSFTGNKAKEQQQESQIIVLLVVAYLISYYVHPQLIPYLHFMFFPFLYGVQWFSYYKHGQHWYLMDFPIFIHVLIAIHILLFQDNRFLFSVCWMLGVGYCSFAIFLWKSVMYFELRFFFPFYMNFSAPLIMYIDANYLLNEQQTLQNKQEIIEKYLMPYYGFALSTIYVLFWSLINILLISMLYEQQTIKLAVNNEKDANEDVNNKRKALEFPFIKISKIYSKIFCPLHEKYVSDHRQFYLVYCYYVIFTVLYLWIVGGVSIFLFQFPWIGFGFIVLLFVWASVQGTRLFIANVRQEIKMQNRQVLKT